MEPLTKQEDNLLKALIIFKATSFGRFDSHMFSGNINKRTRQVVAQFLLNTEKLVPVSQSGLTIIRELWDDLVPKQGEQSQASRYSVIAEWSKKKLIELEGRAIA